MAETSKPAPTPAPAEQVPVQAKDSGQAQPQNSQAAQAAQATEPGLATSAATQAGEDDNLEAKRPRDYVLKEGQEHSAIVEGELRTYQPGDKVRLSPDQYASFKDKFEDPAAKK